MKGGWCFYFEVHTADSPIGYQNQGAPRAMSLNHGQAWEQPGIVLLEWTPASSEALLAPGNCSNNRLCSDSWLPAVFSEMLGLWRGWERTKYFIWPTSWSVEWKALEGREDTSPWIWRFPGGLFCHGKVPRKRAKEGWKIWWTRHSNGPWCPGSQTPQRSANTEKSVRYFKHVQWWQRWVSHEMHVLSAYFSYF